MRNNEKGIVKINCVINLLETKYRFLFNKPQHSELKNSNDPKVFIKYSNEQAIILKKDWKILLIYDYMITAIIGNTKSKGIVTECFIGGRKLNMSSVFISKQAM